MFNPMNKNILFLLNIMNNIFLKTNKNDINNFNKSTKKL